ncbi:MAG: UvrD-helicase domain-containing protein [Methylococcaceae bacterium]
MSNYADTSADLEIKECINQYQNFAVIAGAGSGKTTSLIKALSYVRNKHGKLLRRNNQNIVCITYTNAAVDVIKRRINSDELFFVSTIHVFLWRLIENHQSDIKTILKNKLIPEQIEKKRKDDDGGNNQKAQKARRRIDELTNELNNINHVNSFNYGDNGRRDYSSGKLNHDDIVDLSAIMIAEFSNLQKIIGQKYPFIFIDESQDTFSNVIEALNSVVMNSKQLPMMGYFGDSMQRIYDNNEEFKFPDSFKPIQKVENYRCSAEVIKLLNAIRPDLQQKPWGNNKTGSVKIRLIEAETGNGKRNTYTEEQIYNALNRFDNALEYFGWKQLNEVKQLFLTRQMIAQRQGFSGLNQLFTGEYASKSTEDDFKEGKHFALKPFMEVLIPLIEAHNRNDHSSIIKVMRQNSPLLDPRGTSQYLSIRDVTEKAQIAIHHLVNSWQDDNLKDILNIANKYELISLSERLAKNLDREPRTEIYDESLYEREKSDWLIDTLFQLKTNELIPYRNFILNLTPYSTQHGVKGDEFKKVLVVFDDTEANWHHYNFSRWLTPITAGKEATEGQKKKSLNLAYVCFSRAMEDLRIILFTTNPEQAKNELLKKRWFTDEQISIQNS